MGRWPDKYVIGLTGNIATGKSLVRKMLEHLGAFSLDADGLAHQAMSPGAPAYKPVVESFGRWILAPDGKINRGALAKVVFTDLEALARLERITHPVVHQAIDILVRRAKRKVVIIEAIKLLEAGYGDEVDAVWVVNAPPEVVLNRLMTRRKMQEATARLYMQSQPPQAQKLERADLVIDNSGSLEDTWMQVQREWRKLPVIAGRPPEPEQVTTVKVQPKPAAEAATSAPTIQISEVNVRRGTPANAEQIAEVLSRLKGAEVSRMDVMMAFGEKAYLLAEGDGQVVGVVGMLVENLITRVDEFYLLPGAPAEPVVQGLTRAVEDNSQSLESEVAFFFLPQSLPQATLDAFETAGYEARELEDIKVPAWREAARDSRPEGTLIYAKKLRAERVLKPL